MKLPAKQQVKKLVDTLSARKSIDNESLSKYQRIANELEKSETKDDEFSSLLYLAQAYIYFHNGKLDDAKRFLEASYDVRGESFKEYEALADLLNKKSGDAEKVKTKAPKTILDKNTKYINDTAKSARVLGWLLIAVFLLSIAANNGGFDLVTMYLVYFLFVLPAAIYLILSGYYIKNRQDKTVPKLLLINGFVSLIGAPGIIPLIVSIQSFVAYSKAKKLNFDDESLTRENKWWPGVVAIFIFFGLTILTIGSIYGKHDNTDISSYEESTPSAINDSWDATSKQQLKDSCISNIQNDLINLGYEMSVVTNTCTCMANYAASNYTTISEYNLEYTDDVDVKVTRNCAISSGVEFES